MHASCTESFSVKSILEENEKLRNENFSLRMQIFHLSSSSQGHLLPLDSMMSAIGNHLNTTETISSSLSRQEENNKQLIEIINNLKRELELLNEQHQASKSEMHILKKENERLRKEIKALKLESIQNKFVKERNEIDRVL